MGANKEKCSKIKDLEERLNCLKDKFDQLTDQLEATRRDSASDEGILDYHQLMDERRILERHMEVVEAQLTKAEKETTFDAHKTNKVKVGHTVLLVNSNGKLRFRLVEELITSEEKQLSVESPIGKAVFGKRVGDDIHVVTPKGKIHYQIKSIA